MRKEVSAISQADLHRRLEAPHGDDEVSRLARTLNGMLERLDVAHRREQQLVSDAAHELRNPIAAIRHLTEVALAHPEGTTLEALAAEILAEDLRLQDLAEGLLLLARADEFALEMSAVPIDLDDLVLEEARRLKLTPSLRVQTTGVGPARTTGDRSHLKRVVQNLADNAARHASSTVGFSVQDIGEQVRLTVDDDGPGVPVAVAGPHLREVRPPRSGQGSGARRRGARARDRGRDRFGSRRAGCRRRVSPWRGQVRGVPAAGILIFGFRFPSGGFP